MFEMIVKKIVLENYRDRFFQVIYLETPQKQVFPFKVNKKIDLTEFKEKDKVLVTFSITKKGISNTPYFFINSIKHVILKGVDS